MPIVMPWMQHEYLPTITDLTLTDAFAPGHPYRIPLHELTDNFLSDLPVLVANSINTTDQSLIKPAQVLVLPQIIHPWARNAFDWWIDVQPDDTEDWADREPRRWEISTELKRQITLWLGNYPEDMRPHFDAECRPINASGVSTNKTGTITHEWGKPKSVPSHIGTKL